MRAMKPGDVGRHCLDNYPEKRRAALRYACCYRTAQSGGRFGGGTAANFLPHRPPAGTFPRSGSHRLQQTTSRARSGVYQRRHLSLQQCATAGVPRFSQRCFQGPILRCECARAFSVGPCQTATNLMFVLTKEEKRVICFVMLAILVGLGVKEYRRGHPANGSGGQHGLKQSLGKPAEAKPRQNDTAASPASTHK
jgi:hypothetical protein